MNTVMQAGWLADLTNWIKDAIVAMFTALARMLTDFVIYAIEGILNLVEAMITAIPMPDFLTNVTICGLLNQAGPTAQWIMGIMQIPAGMSLIAAGVGFRLLRKLVTLFQW